MVICIVDPDVIALVQTVGELSIDFLVVHPVEQCTKPPGTIERKIPGHDKAVIIEEQVADFFCIFIYYGMDSIVQIIGNHVIVSRLLQRCPAVAGGDYQVLVGYVEQG